jgi:hypothetical protein
MKGRYLAGKVQKLLKTQAQRGIMINDAKTKGDLQ